MAPRPSKSPYVHFLHANVAARLQPFEDEAQTALFKDPVRTAQ